LPEQRSRSHRFELKIAIITVWFKAHYEVSNPFGESSVKAEEFAAIIF